MPKKMTRSEFIRQARDVHGGKYNYFKVVFDNRLEPIVVTCNRHGDFKTNVYKHLRGRGCKLCETENSFIKKVWFPEYFTDKSIYMGSVKDIVLTCQKHGDFTVKAYSCLRENGGRCPDYVSSKKNITVICSKHGEFHQTPKSHLKGSGCPICSGKIKKTTETFTEEAKKVHGDRYDYSKVDYVSNKKNITVICSKHGEFHQTPKSHLKGSGCPICSGRVNDYVSSKKNITVICSKHGEFHQTPKSHLKGSGCPICSGKIKKTTETFIEEAKKVHGDRYDYSKVDYVSNKKNITVICSKHGEFKTQPKDHIHKGTGCPMCGRAISCSEQDIARWVMQFHSIETNKRFYVDGVYKYELDIFIPSLNLGIEYNGLEFHHTHGRTYQGKDKFHKDKYYHRNKSEWFMDNHGIRLIHIWEHEWLFRQEIVKNILGAQLGVNRERIFARKCSVKIVRNTEAKQLFESSHLQGNTFSTVNYGLFFNNEMVSVMSFSKSTQGDEDWELTRFTNKLGTVVVGGAERLFTRFKKDHNPATVKSFSMNRIFSGALYAALGFQKIGVLPPTYFYHNGKRIVLRRSAQKKNLHRILPGYVYSEDKTEVEVMNENGWFQVFDTGITKWRYNRSCSD